MTDKSHTTNPTETDPIVEIGRQLMELEARYEALDRATSTQRGSGKIYAEAEMSDTLDKIYALKDYVSTLRAESFEGALQLAMASGIFDYINASEPNENHRRSDRLKFNRLVYSATDFLRNNPELKLSSGAVPRYMSDHLNPWLPHEKRLEMIDERVTT